MSGFTKESKISGVTNDGIAEKTRTWDEKLRSNAGPRGGPQFLPNLLGKKVLYRMTDGRPLHAILSGYNSYEIVFDMGKGKKMLCFKHAIASIEYESASDINRRGSVSLRGTAKEDAPQDDRQKAFFDF